MMTDSKKLAHIHTSRGELMISEIAEPPGFSIQRIRADGFREEIVLELGELAEFVTALEQVCRAYQGWLR
jgi:hypothetical protein